MKKFIVLTLVCFLVAGTAKANFFLNSTYDFNPVAAGGGGACDGLDNSVTGVLMDLDATCADSYTSGQTFNNLAATGTDYDFLLGSTSGAEASDPTFTGTAGDSGAYFAHDGGDFFRIAGGNTTFINNMPKTTGGEDFTVCWKGTVPAGHDTTSGIFGTQGQIGDGVEVWLRGNNQFTQHNQEQGTNSSFSISDAAVSVGASNYVCVGHDHANNITTYWVNTTTGQDEAHTYGTGTGGAEFTMELGSVGNDNFIMQDGFQSKAFVLIDHYATDAEIADIVTGWSARHD